MTSSPNWKKPSDVMKTRLLKRRKSSISSNLTGDTTIQQECKNAVVDQFQKTGSKRKNPFASTSQEKKVCAQNLELGRETVGKTTQSPANALFEALDQPQVHSSDTEGVKPVTGGNDNKVSTGVEHVLQNPSPKSNFPKTKLHDKTSKEAEKLKFYPSFPIDWSVKTKVRYISQKPFSWCAPLKSHEESAGLIRHTKNCASEDNIRGVQVHTDSVEAKTEFQKCCLLWSHPHISWLKTFPRVVNDTKIGKPSPAFQGEEIQSALLNDWTKSFTSLFQLVRSGHCPYFYLCSHICSALFRAPGVGRELISAIVTPSTRGFRESLKEEGVEFEMPLNRQRKIENDPNETLDADTIEIATQAVTESNEKKNCDKSSAVETENTETDDVDDDITQTDEGASSWLATLGIDRSKYRSLDPNKVKIQREAFKIIDNRPESAVYVEGPDTNALFNFLLNCRSCVNSTGELAGVPPQLVAPCPFKGATLTCLTVKQGAIRQQLENGKVQEAYSCELTGPILPYSLQNLHELFRQTQGDYISSCSVQETTTPFNLSVDGDCGTIKEYLGKNCEENSLVERTKSDQNIAKKAVPVHINDKNNGRQAIREFHCQNNEYCWL